MAPRVRFLRSEVAEMEELAKQLDKVGTPSRDVVEALAARFSASPDRAGRNDGVQPVQIFTWFKNQRRRNNLPKPPRNPNALVQESALPKPLQPTLSGNCQAHVGAPPYSPAARQPGSSAGKVHVEGGQVQFEVKLARDGAWYDVAAFLDKRNSETGDLEIKVRLYGLESEDDEWVDVRTCEGQTQALYFDAHVTSIQRRRHDIRGCRFRFLIRYDHDQYEEIVMLRKLCRRPELIDHRIQTLHAAEDAAYVHPPPKEANVELTSQSTHVAGYQHQRAPEEESANTSSLKESAGPPEPPCNDSVIRPSEKSVEVIVVDD